VLILRELGVVIVCIMVAGRSGSAYTAELGSMKMREEIDALRTMGFDPVEVLILPRILALMIAVPILTFLGSLAALYGGGLVSWVYGGIEPAIFISRLRDAISIETFEVGMIKAPFMAIIIGLVACVQGLQVQGSAEALGSKVTVVEGTNQLLPGNDPDLMLRCLRAGAADFLLEPFTADQLDTVLAKIARMQPAAEKGADTARIIAVSGGTIQKSCTRCDQPVL